MADDNNSALKSISDNLGWIALWLFVIAVNSCDIPTKCVDIYGENSVIINGCEGGVTK